MTKTLDLKPGDKIEMPAMLNASGFIAVVESAVSVDVIPSETDPVKENQ
jgi:energy-converting hydrogenase Eha subunit C